MQEKLKQSLLQFHAIIENEGNQLRWGSITFNIFLKDGVPLIKTLNIVSQKRRKYQLKREEVKICRSINISKRSATLPK